MAPRDNGQRKFVCRNRKARHIYHIEETVDAGLVLKGTEVKSLRGGQASLVDTHAQVQGSELYLHNFHISPYEKGNIHNVDPMRPRKLLLHRREINRLIGAIARKGYTLIPLSVYFSNGWAKVELGVARGKKLYDKREDMKRRDHERDIQRALREERK